MIQAENHYEFHLETIWYLALFLTRINKFTILLQRTQTGFYFSVNEIYQPIHSFFLLTERRKESSSSSSAFTISIIKNRKRSEKRESHYPIHCTYTNSGNEERHANSVKKHNTENIRTQKSYSLLIGNTSTKQLNYVCGIFYYE